MVSMDEPTEVEQPISAAVSNVLSRSIYSEDKAQMESIGKALEAILQQGHIPEELPTLEGIPPEHVRALGFGALAQLRRPLQERTFHLPSSDSDSEPEKVPKKAKGVGGEGTSSGKGYFKRVEYPAHWWEYRVAVVGAIRAASASCEKPDLIAPAVEETILGKANLADMCTKYSIPKSTLQKPWKRARENAERYLGGEEGLPEVLKARITSDTTFEEVVALIGNGNDGEREGSVTSSKGGEERAAMEE